MAANRNGAATNGSTGNGSARAPTSSDDADEVTPLLAASDIAPSAEPKALDAEPQNGNGNAAAAESQEDDDKPLPLLQIFLLCLARFIEPTAFFTIFPYIYDMTRDAGGLDEADVGFYAGLVESLFSLTQMCVMIWWGKAADRYGRKPGLIISLYGVTIFTMAFGFARTIWQMILFRCLGGVFAGTVVTIRTMIAEHSTSKNQARAFSWFAFTGNLGIMVGPMLGGALANPAKLYPGLFGNVKFFKDFPYALPTLVVGGFALIIATVCQIFVKETLPKELQRSVVPAHRHGDEEGSVQAPPAPPKPEIPSIGQLLRMRGVGIVLYVYAHVMVLAFAYTAIVPIFWPTSVELGGLGFTSVQIALMMMIGGLAQALWLLIIFPPLQKRIGTNGVMRLCGMAYPWFFLLLPLANMLLKANTHATVLTFWILFPILLVVFCGVSMSFTAIQLAVNEVSPGPTVLGTLNALSLTLVSGIRAVSPALFNALFAIGAGTQLLGGYAIWLLMAVLAALFCLATFYLPDYELLRKQRQEEEREERARGGQEEGIIAAAVASLVGEAQNQ